MLLFNQQASGELVRAIPSTGANYFVTGWEVVQGSLPELDLDGIILPDMAAVATKIKNMQAQSNSFAQTYYNVLVSEGGGENRIMPDMIFPDPDVLANLTAEEIYGMYLAYMRGVQDWFGNYSVMSPDNVNISAESMKLKVRGSIYHANGTLAYANTTIFTPYVSLQSMNLIIGNNTMTQPGFAIRWGSGSSLADFVSGNRIQDVKYIPLAVGDYMIIEEMLLDGVAKDTVPLTVHTVQYITIGEDDLNPVTPPQGLTDAEWLMNHWYWFAVILGGIFCLAWVATRNTAIGVIGLILLLVGGVFWIITDMGGTTGLLSGLFSMRRGP